MGTTRRPGHASACRKQRLRRSARADAQPERTPLPERTPRIEREAYPGRPYERPLHAEQVRNAEAELRPDPLAEIRQRQRALEASRERLHARREEALIAEQPPPGRRVAEKSGFTATTTSALRPAAESSRRYRASAGKLRQDLKRDIAESITREVSALRAEIRDIRSNAEDKHFAADVREDMARLADSISQLAGHRRPAGNCWSEGGIR